MSNWINVWDINTNSSAYMNFTIGIENFIDFKGASCLEDLPLKARKQLTGLFMCSLKYQDIDWLLEEPECSMLTYLTGKYLENNQDEKWAKKIADKICKIAIEKCEEQINHYFEVMYLATLRNTA